MATTMFHKTDGSVQWEAAVILPLPPRPKHAPGVIEIHCFSCSLPMVLDDCTPWVNGHWMCLACADAYRGVLFGKAGA